MKLGTRGRYAVAAMADIARWSNGQPINLASIEERQGISLSYLEQLFLQLRRANIVGSVRGPGGGYRLSRHADDIALSEIIAAVDEPLVVTRCRPDTPGGCMATGERCQTHDLWDELTVHIYNFFETISLGDVIAHRVKGRAKPMAVTASDFPNLLADLAAQSTDNRL